jgi:hypothetical protein
MTRRRLPREIFLSHASKDRRQARELAQALRDVGLKVWYSESHLQGAQPWHDELGRALKRCDWLLLLLTPSAIRSKWVKRELVYALSDDRYEDHIIPFILKPCNPLKLSWVLQTIQMIDATSNRSAAIQKVSTLWGIGAKKVRPRRKSG